MKLTARNTRRDIAYFFVGLIISFALSGIFLNHRQSWHPRRYIYESKEISIALVQKDSIPVLGQMTKLHQDTSQWWIYYSDIFGIAMIVIGTTGMFIQNGIHCDIAGFASGKFHDQNHHPSVTKITDWRKQAM
jgi:uncharacterized protein